MGDDRSLTEKLFKGNPGTVFTCKVLTFTPQTYSAGTSLKMSDGSINARATVQIIKVYFGAIDTSVITLKANSPLSVNNSYLIYAYENGHEYSFGSECDRWSKPFSTSADFVDEVRLLEEFAVIHRNKKSGKFTFKNGNGTVLATGTYKRGVPAKTWKHYYNSGIIKAELDYQTGTTKKYSPMGSITAHNIGNKNIATYEYFGSGKLKIVRSWEKVDISDMDTIVTADGEDYKEYYESGVLRVEGVSVGIKRIYIWRWYNEDGTLYAEFDYKNGIGNQ